MAVAILFASTSFAYAHGGRMSDDGCHNDNKVVEVHWHVPGTTERAGICIRTEDDFTIHERVIEVETIVKIPPEEVVDSVNQVIDRLEQAIASEANRRPRVVEVEVEVPSLKATSEECVTLRAQFKSEIDRWGGDENAVGLRAIRKGCW